MGLMSNAAANTADRHDKTCCCSDCTWGSDSCDCGHCLACEVEALAGEDPAEALAGSRDERW